MSLSEPVVLAEARNTSARASYTTASITPEPDSLLILSVRVGGYGTVVARPVSSVTGNGLTWTRVGTELTSVSTVRVDVWAAYTGAAPVAGPLTITFPASVSNTAWHIVQFAGAGTGVPRSTVAAGSGDTSLSLPGVAATSGQLAVVGVSSSGASVTSPGYTSIGRQGGGLPSSTLEVLYRHPAETDTALSLTNAAVAAVVLEVPEAVEPDGHLVLGGVEVPVSLAVVRDGIEVPVTAIEIAE